VKTTDVKNPASLVDALSAMARGVGLRKAPGDPAGYVQGALARITAREAEGFAEVAKGDGGLAARQEVFGLLLFILDHVADLQDKRALWLEVIGHAPDLPLAGAQVAGFAGFFDEQWRAYDYRRGRVDAWNAFTGQGGKAPGLLGDYRQESLATQPSKPGPADPDEYNVDLAFWRARLGKPNFPRVTFDDVSPDLQKTFVARVTDRLKALLGVSGLGGFALGMLLKPKIKKFLGGGQV
jgi:hypothetical protein